MRNLKFAAKLWLAGYKSWLVDNKLYASILAALALLIGSCVG